MSRASRPAADRAGALRAEPRSGSQAKPLIADAIEVVDVAEFHRRLKAQCVSGAEHSALVCPMCKTVQSMASLIAAGATPERAERLIGFSCEGRLTGAGPWPNKPTAKRRAVRGCDWSLGGLFQLHKLEVVTDDGEHHPRFIVAAPEDAQALARRIEARRDETQSGSVHESAVRDSECAQPSPSQSPSNTPGSNQ